MYGFARRVGLKLRRSEALRGLLRKLLRTTHLVGVNVSRYRGLGSDLDADIAYLLRDVSAPVIFDVGANTGQTVRRIRSLIPGCLTHAFEPSPETFRQLEANTRGMKRVDLICAGVGSVDGEQTLLENVHSDMSSFLAPAGPGAGGEIVRRTSVRVVTLDTYCEQHAIERIDLLKVDTEGFDLEVLRGAKHLLAEERIGLVRMEVIFSDMYHGVPPFDETYRFMLDHGFRLLSFYNLHVAGGVASWGDAMFVSRP